MKPRRQLKRYDLQRELMRATMARDRAGMATLLGYGANPFSTSFVPGPPEMISLGGRNPLVPGLFGGTRSSVLQRIFQDRHMGRRRSAFDYALSDGDAEGLTLILQGQARVPRDERSLSTVMRALPGLLRNSAEVCGVLHQMVLLLLSKGADPNRASLLGERPLKLAVSSGWVPLVTTLLDAGAAHGPGPMDPLHLLAQAIMPSDQLELFELLTTRAVHRPLASEERVFLARFAAANGAARILQALVDNHPEALLPAGDGSTLLHALFDQSHLNLRAIIMIGSPARGAPGWNSERNQIRAAMLQQLLAYGFDPNLPDPRCGGTPLHVACDQGYIDLIEPLLDAGADSLLVDRMGQRAEDLTDDPQALALLRSRRHAATLEEAVAAPARAGGRRL